MQQCAVVLHDHTLDVDAGGDQRLTLATDIDGHGPAGTQNGGSSSAITEVNNRRPRDANAVGLAGRQERKIRAVKGLESTLKPQVYLGRAMNTDFDGGIRR